MRPSCCSGISECTSPRPAVIHCTLPGNEHALVAVVVPVAHAPVEHVGDGLEAPMRVVGEARDVVLGLVGAELVEHQEGIEVGQLRLPDHAASFTPAPSDVGMPLTDAAPCGPRSRLPS